MANRGQIQKPGVESMNWQREQAKCERRRRAVQWFVPGWILLLGVAVVAILIAAAFST
jgi:hypothetical protein